MRTRMAGTAAALALFAGGARATPSEAELTAPPVRVTVLSALPGVERLGLAVEAWGGPTWLTGASDADPRWSVLGGIALDGIATRDWLELGDVVTLGARLGYGTVDVDADSAVEHDFVIVAGNEPWLVTGTNQFTGTERLAMAVFLGEAGYAFAADGPLVPFLRAGVGVVELFGDRGKTSFAARLAAGVEWRLGPTVGATLEVSDLVFRAPVLAGHPVHGVALAVAVRFRF